MTSIHQRRDYARATLTEAEASRDPLDQFASWFAEAGRAGLDEPYAMTLATATPDGRPSARVVLLRGFDRRGFRFFTNYRSQKGRELDANPRAALLFDWHEIERQVRVEGPVTRLSDPESDAYFEGRPAESKLGAWASDQSVVIADRDVLDARLRAVADRFADVPVPRPPHWGGYRVEPECFEFWQGRVGRLHDRLRYHRDGDRWIIERLAP